MLVCLKNGRKISNCRKIEIVHIAKKIVKKANFKLLEGNILIFIFQDLSYVKINLNNFDNFKGDFHKKIFDIGKSKIDFSNNFVFIISDFEIKVFKFDFLNLNLKNDIKFLFSFKSKDKILEFYSNFVDTLGIFILRKYDAIESIKILIGSTKNNFYYYKKFSTFNMPNNVFKVFMLSKNKILYILNNNTIFEYKL